jgi:hypothetical protein
MENSRAALAALIFIVAIVGINFVMYAIARGFARGGGQGPLETMMKALSPAGKKKDEEFDELRRTVRDLTEGKKDPPNHPE